MVMLFLAAPLCFTKQKEYVLKLIRLSCEPAPLLAQVKRELAGVLIFESHAKAGTVCKYCDKISAVTLMILVRWMTFYKKMFLFILLLCITASE